MLVRIQELGLPPLEPSSVAQARAFSVMMATDRPPGPEVGEVVDGVLPGPAGSLSYRRYRPATPGPHPIVVYFHGGGWVLGGLDSDDPFCRDLCVKSNAVVVSVDYRHAPEARFPAAVDDGFAAVRWIATNAETLGGVPGKLAVCGWSAGGNIAAVVCQMARDAGGPRIAGQVLVTPVTDCDFTRESYVANGDGYVLTTALMRWFWNHYADPAAGPKASPLRRATSPASLLRSSSRAVRSATRRGRRVRGALAAGVERHSCRGRVHTSVPAGTILSAAGGGKSARSVGRRDTRKPHPGGDRVARRR